VRAWCTAVGAVSKRVSCNKHGGNHHVLEVGFSITCVVWSI
jgi:hypothetical protein